MNIRLEVLSLLTVSRSQASSLLACFSCSRSGWKLLPFDGFLSVNSTYSPVLRWENYPSVFARFCCFSSLVLMVGGSLVVGTALPIVAG